MMSLSFFSLQRILAVRVLYAALLLPLLCMPAIAQVDGYLKTLPTPDEIIAAFPIEGEGKERLDAAARQQAAFNHVSTIIYRNAHERSKPLKFTLQEEKAYKALDEDARARIRSLMGYPPYLCGNNSDCQDFESRVIDYGWRNKKMARAFEKDLNTRLFPQNIVHHTPQSVATSWMKFLTALGGLVLGIFIARPWRVFYHGTLESLGSGITVEGSGAIRMVENRRNHIRIGNTEIGEAILSQRMDDELNAALDSNAQLAIGVGRIFIWRWVLFIRNGNRVLRANFFGVLGRALLLIPFFSILAAIVALMLVSSIASLPIALGVCLFCIGLGLGQILANIRAWLGTGMAATPSPRHATP
ncbi:MAG: hypothetical protein CME89_08465 [Hirschia sp.]|nr:hypothetical protein [Hirschia sp.]|tara:strand:- start:594 stop:1667 length:1074 start_codon:yes stop_codon:yes gene_type:complete